MGSFSSKTKAVVRVQQQTIKPSQKITTTENNQQACETRNTSGIITNTELAVVKEGRSIVKTAEQESKMTKGNIIVSCHSKNKNVADEVYKLLCSQGYNVLIVTEDIPVNLDVREHCIQWCDVFVIVATFYYQRSPHCVELANYAKDKKKPVVGLLSQKNFRPTGSIAAISLAWGKSVDFNTEENADKRNSSILEALQEKLNDVPLSEIEQPNESYFEASAPVVDEEINENHVCICYAEDGASVAGMIRSGKGVSNQGAQANSMSQFLIKMGNSKAPNKDLIRNCEVFIPIMTTGYQSSQHCREDYEYARVCKKTIIPVKGENFWPSGWLSLGIAGKLYYQLIDSKEACTRHLNVPDSTPMNDFIYAVMDATSGAQQTVEEKENVEITGLTREVAEIKSQLLVWPPKEREQTNVNRKPPPPEKLMSQDTEKLPFRHIDYAVTRMSFSPPKPLFDKLGLSIKQTFDVMLSYQWDIQTLVRNFYCDFDIKTIKTWMDVWGGMQGNINQAMATAVENSTVIISFLTEKYQKSINCNLELKYAKECGKPIVFIMVERGLVLKDWIKEMVDESVCIEIRSFGEFGEIDKGVPKINRVAEAVRNLIKWAGSLPKALPRDVSEQVYSLQNTLENAKFALADQEQRIRFETCTRCKAQFEPENKSGCKKHRAYFMGGNIIAGRWVCCSQREKTSLGCEATDHITTKRGWKQMPGFNGCYQWNPQ